MIVFGDLTVDECKQKLIDSEHLDFETFKATALAGLERWREDYDSFLAWGFFLVDRAGKAVDQNDDELLEYHAMILYPIFDYARENLTNENYQDFQVKMMSKMDSVMESAYKMRAMSHLGTDTK